MTRYLTIDEVLELHRLVIEQSGGGSGVRDLNGLESAVAQPRMAFGGADPYQNHLTTLCSGADVAPSGTIESGLGWPIRGASRAVGSRSHQPAGRSPVRGVPNQTLHLTAAAGGGSLPECSFAGHYSRGPGTPIPTCARQVLKAIKAAKVHA